MTRKLFKPTPLAIAMQAASLLIIASSLFGILISEIIAHRVEVARGEAASLVALPPETDPTSR